MSAGPAPPNPGTPRKAPGSGISTPTALARYGPRILLGGVALGAAYTFFATRAPGPPGTPGAKPFSTSGVKNIESAYTNAGATSTHTKAYGGTQQGDKKDENLKEGGGTGHPKGFEQDNIGEEQRPVQPNKVGKAFNDMKYGSEKSK